MANPSIPINIAIKTSAGIQGDPVQAVNLSRSGQISGRIDSKGECVLTPTGWKAADKVMITVGGTLNTGSVATISARGSVSVTYTNAADTSIPSISL